MPLRPSGTEVRNRWRHVDLAERRASPTLKRNQYAGEFRNTGRQAYAIFAKHDFSGARGMKLCGRVNHYTTVELDAQRTFVAALPWAVAKRQLQLVRQREINF